MSRMRFFVSYTRRDGVVTSALLAPLRSRLNQFGVPFIHELQPKHPRTNAWREQARIVRALMRSDIVILLETPLVYQSPWVRFELAVARLLLRPVLKLDAGNLAAVQIAAR